MGSAGMTGLLGENRAEEITAGCFQNYQKLKANEPNKIRKHQNLVSIIKSTLKNFILRFLDVK